jgi:hypothetical protein
MGKFSRGSLRPFFLTVVISIFAVSATFIPGVFSMQDTTPPVISVWYGLHQTFGKPGLAQHWINILGNANDPQSKVSRLQYRLNGGSPLPLQMGPDKRRLLMPGDFNVEIDPANLRQGDNQLVIEALNSAGLPVSMIVTVTFQPSAEVLPLPYRIDWSRVKNAQQVLQIVDGKWAWDANGIRPLEIGYDRMLTVGDSRWTNYQVTVSVLVHRIDPTGFHDKYSGKQASMAVDLRWVGHSDIPVSCPQPHCGWDPVGNFNKFFFKQNDADYLGMKVHEKETGYPTKPYTFHPGDTYIFKVSVETISQGTQYRMKVWEKGTEKEPVDWTFDRIVPLSESSDVPAHGAFALVPHYLDVTIGNILVEPIPGK